MSTHLLLSHWLNHNIMTSAPLGGSILLVSKVYKSTLLLSCFHFTSLFLSFSQKLALILSNGRLLLHLLLHQKRPPPLLSSTLNIFHNSPLPLPKAYNTQKYQLSHSSIQAVSNYPLPLPFFQSKLPLSLHHFISKNNTHLSKKFELKIPSFETKNLIFTSLLNSTILYKISPHFQFILTCLVC